jgi:branched-chain amino acid transport system permease protein
MSSVELYLSALVAGIAVGCMYALVALGYNLVYNATGVFNFAQGDFVALGGLLTYSLLVTRNWNVLLLVLPVVGSVALIALLQERVSIAPLLRRGEASMGWVITTLGASVVLQNILQLIWGSESTPVPALVPGGPIRLGSVPVPYSNVVIVVVAVLCAVGLEVWSRRTLAGKAWMATAEDRDAALIRGIHVRRIGAVSFLVAGAVSGLAGLVTVPVTSAVFDSGAVLALQGFVAIAIGGFGNQLGALAGGVILGVVQAEALLFLGPSYRNIVALALLVIVLLARPTGLFGYRREREV